MRPWLAANPQRSPLCRNVRLQFELPEKHSFWTRAGKLSHGALHRRARTNTAKRTTEHVSHITRFAGNDTIPNRREVTVRDCESEQDCGGYL